MPEAHVTAALEEIKAVLKKHDVAGFIVVQSPTNAQYFYGIEPTWSCAKFHPAPGGDVIRIRAKESEYGSKEARDTAIADTAAMIVGFMQLAEQAVENFTRLAGMLSHHVGITSFLRDERHER